MFRTIVLALDGSQASDRAIPVASELSRDGAKVVVAHIREVMVGRGATGLPAHADEDELEAKIRGQAQDLKDSGIDVVIDLGSAMAGGPAHVIADIARKEGADLIVTGTRGHSPVAGLLLGSVTQRLLHIAPCPVLVVPAEHRPAAVAAGAKEAAATR